MERKIITKRINEIMGDISRLNNTLYALDTTDIQRYPDNYEILSTDAALRGEKIACRLRHLIYSSTKIKKEDYLNSAGVIHGIDIKHENGIMEITLPSLLPKRKQHQGSEFLFDPFFFTLDRYANKNQMPKYRHCVVCFSHIYNRKLPSRRIRDYDNLELKQILDTISTFIMTDDSGLLCDAYNTTELGDADFTLVSIMDKDSFPAWLEARKNNVEFIKDFSE
jgi:hypothetical protein